MGDSPEFEARRIDGSGCKEHLLRANVDLPEPALDIQEVRKTVLIDSASVTLGHVILHGRVRGQFTFQAFRSGTAPPLPGNASGCSGIVSIASGELAATTLDLAFVAAIPIEGAAPGMSVVVRDAFVSASVSEPTIDQQGLMRSMCDTSALFLSVEVLQLVTVIPEPDPDPPALTPPSKGGSAAICQFGFRPGGGKSVAPKARCLPTKRK